MDILTEPLLQCAMKTFVKPLLVWKGDVVDSPPGDPDPEESNTNPGQQTRVTNDPRMVMTNHG